MTVEVTELSVDAGDEWLTVGIMPVKELLSLSTRNFPDSFWVLNCIQPTLFQSSHLHLRTIIIVIIN